MQIRDGKIYDQSSAEISINGETVVYDCEIQYGTGEVTIGTVFAGGKPVAFTPGQQGIIDLTVKMPLDAWSQMANKLGARYKSKTFAATVVYTDRDGNSIVDKINGLRIVDDKTDISTGSDAIMAELTCKALTVLREGRESF